MARPRANKLPKYLEFNTRTRSYYYKNPKMANKARLGPDKERAVGLARRLNSRLQTQLEQESRRLEAIVDFESPYFDGEFERFVDKYIADFRLKISTAKLIRQRQKRLCHRLDGVQMAAIDTQILREAIAEDSQFEQSKLKSLLSRFFKYSKSTGNYPTCLPNPVDDLFVDPIPPKKRHRITLPQFRAIYSRAPNWLKWLMTLGIHLALRRVDLVNLRFEDVIGDRIISPIRKTDSQARGLEATSIDFPMHPDVRRVIAESRKSSLELGRCPFVIHRSPGRKNWNLVAAINKGTLQHEAQVLPDYASKTFKQIRRQAMRATDCFDGLSGDELPTLHEIRSLSSHLYSRAGVRVSDVQSLMAHTDPDMTRAYQKGHARQILRVDMLLPISVGDGLDSDA